MNFKIWNKHGKNVVVAESEEVLIRDVDSALDFVMSLRYETDCDRIALNKEAVSEDFFVLSTCLAGKIVQKFVNYQIKFALYGDFSEHEGKSKALRDFIFESNRGRDLFFADTADGAMEMLAAAE